jgi:hypothetical protein
MTLLNYNLAGGNKVLLTQQAHMRDMFFQLWFTGIVATDVKVEVWVSSSPNEAYRKVESAEKTLVGANGTEYISLSGLAFAYVQFRLVVGSAASGVITKVDILY